MILRFNTKEMRFESDLGLVYPNLQVEEKDITLTVNGPVNLTKKFEKDTDSCFLLLKKIKTLECNKRFNYHGLKYLLPGVKEIALEGDLDLIEHDNVQIAGVQYAIARYKGPSVNSPIFEQNILKFDLSYNDSDQLIYSLYVNFNNGECFEKKKAMLLDYGSCSHDSLLNYYSQENLQTSVIDNKIEVLKFSPHKGYLEEYDMSSRLINKIDVYDMQLVPGDEDRLFIKGLDISQNAVNKKYIVKISKNSFCSRAFKLIENEFENFYIKQAEQGRYNFWKLLKGKSKLSDAGVFKSFGGKQISYKGKKYAVEQWGNDEIQNRFYLQLNEINGNWNKPMKIYLTRCNDCINLLTIQLANKAITPEENKGVIEEKPLSHLPEEISAKKSKSTFFKSEKSKSKDDIKERKKIASGSKIDENSEAITPAKGIKLPKMLREKWSVISSKPETKRAKNFHSLEEEDDDQKTQ
jgi:hypothetical protein